MNKEHNVTLIAGICHTANKFYCDNIGDIGQMNWDEAPDWQKNSCISGVKFHIENPDAGNDASHKEWLKFKEADGWVYGETKDVDQKTHPCMVSFNELPQQQQRKDAIFRGIVHAFTNHL